MSGAALRVVHACAYFAPAWVYGGPPRSLLALCHTLASAGVALQVVTTTANGDAELPAPVAAAGAFEGLPVHYCRRRGPRAFFYAPGFSAALEGALQHADLLHIHGLWNAAVWRAAAVSRRLGKPYVLSPRGMLEPAARRHHRWRKRAVYAAFDRRVIGDAALLHATSESEVSTLRRLLPARPIVHVPNPIVAPPAAAADVTLRQRYNIPPAAPLLLFLGRLHPIKRLDLIAAAFARVRHACPAAHWIVAGPDEAGLRRPLEQQLGEAARAVTWTGAVEEEEKWELLRAASGVMLSSASESFGMSIAEALAAGTPVIVTRGLPWAQVAERRAGFVVDPTSEAIADACISLLEDPALARGMGARGRAFAEEAFGPARVAAAWTAAYSDVLGAHV